MVGLHGFSFFRSTTPAFTGMTEAVMPDGTVIVWPSTADESWAGVAKLHSGGWAVLADGTARGTVTSATASSWTAHKGEYESKWVIVPVRKAQ